MGVFRFSNGCDTGSHAVLENSKHDLVRKTMRCLEEGVDALAIAVVLALQSTGTLERFKEFVMSVEL